MRAMTLVRNIVDRALVILRAAPTWLTALALIAGVLLDELPQLAFMPSAVLVWLTGFVTILAVATAIVRRVTPVIEDARGVLHDGIKPVTHGETVREVALLELEGTIQSLERTIAGDTLPPPPTVDETDRHPGH